MVVANAPFPANAPQKHSALIKAWADGYEIEFKSDDEWKLVNIPHWHEATQYRIKPTKLKDKRMEALIVLSPHAGPLLYAAAPDEANCVLVFDGTSNKLIKAEVKSPVEALKQPSEALDNHTQWLGSLNEFKRTGEL